MKGRPDQKDKREMKDQPEALAQSERERQDRQGRKARLDQAVVPPALLDLSDRLVLKAKRDPLV